MLIKKTNIENARSEFPPNSTKVSAISILSLRLCLLSLRTAIGLFQVIEPKLEDSFTKSFLSMKLKH